MAGNARPIGLLEALKMAQDRYDAEQASKKPAAPFNFGQTVRDADKAIQAGVFGVTDAIGAEGKRLIDGKFGFDALAQSLPQLAQSGPSNLAEALATTPARVGGGWTNQDLQAQRDRDNLGMAAGGAMDATWLIPPAGAAKATGRIAGDVLGDASSVVAKGARKLGYEPIPNQNALGVFGGPLAKTADHKALDLAKSLEKAGKPREEILSQTGWFKGVDDKWRFEIDDSAAKWLPGALTKRESTVGSVLSNPALLENYPEISDLSLSRRPLDSASGFSSKRNAFVVGGTGEKALKNLHHEIEHYVQQREGFASGGDLWNNTPRFRSAESQAKFDAAFAELKDIKDSVDLPELERRASRTRFSDAAKERGDTSYTQKMADMSEDARPGHNERPFLDRARQLKSEINDLMRSGDLVDPYQTYRRQAGEVEARNVENRFRLNAGERRQLEPWKTQDTPDADQFVGFKDTSGGKDYAQRSMGGKPLLSALMDAFKGKPKESPLDQFTPPKSLDDIFTGGSPRGAREITGGAENPAGMESSFFNDPRFNGPQEAVPYNPESGFGGLDAKFAADKNARTLSEAVAKARAGQPIDPDTLSLLLAYGAASGMGSALWAQQAHQQQPGM